MKKHLLNLYRDGKHLPADNKGYRYLIITDYKNEDTNRRVIECWSCCSSLREDQKKATKKEMKFALDNACGYMEWREKLLNKSK